MKLQRVLPSLVVGFAALACGLPANALSFNWSFTGNDDPANPTFGLQTSGTITGLVEGVNDLTSPGITVAVTSTETSLGLSTFLSSSASSAQVGTVTVTNGLITDYDFQFLDGVPADRGFFATFGLGAQYVVVPNFTFYQGSANIFGSASVPGPLPILGATAAFAWTRRMRKRISLAARSTDASQG